MELARVRSRSWMEEAQPRGEGKAWGMVEASMGGDGHGACLVRG